MQPPVGDRRRRCSSAPSAMSAKTRSPAAAGAGRSNTETNAQRHVVGLGPQLGARRTCPVAGSTGGRNYPLPLTDARRRQLHPPRHLRPFGVFQTASSPHGQLGDLAAHERARGARTPRRRPSDPRPHGPPTPHPDPDPHAPRRRPTRRSTPRAGTPVPTSGEVLRETARSRRVIRPFPVVRMRGPPDGQWRQRQVFSVRAPRAAKMSVRCTGRSCPASRWSRSSRKSRLARMTRFERSLRAGGQNHGVRDTPGLCRETHDVRDPSRPGAAAL